MCRSCTDGGRRCPKTEVTRTNERAAAKRYYQRSKARHVTATLATHGIPAVDDLEAPLTYHYGAPPVLGTPCDVGKNDMPNKPSDALWTAPGRVAADGTVKTGWTDWMAREGLTFDSPYPDTSETPPFDPSILHAVRPQPGAAIIRIAHTDHARALAQAFPADEGAGIQSVSWTAIRETGVDAVMLTESATSVREFSGWDASSVAWLRTDRCALEGTVPRGEYVPNPDAQAIEFDEDGPPGLCFDRWDLSHEDDLLVYDEGKSPRLVQ